MKPKNSNETESNLTVVSMDLTCENQYERVVKTFGGEDFMRKNTPRLYALLNATREKHLREGGPQYKTVLQYTEAPDDFVDGIYIDHVIYDAEQKCVLVKATVSLTEQASWIDCEFDIYTEADEYVATRNWTVFDRNFQTFEFTIKNIDAEKFQSQILVITMLTSWQPAAEQSLRSQLIKRKAYANLLTAVESITVEDPRNINTQPGDSICVVYDRSPGSNEKVDYSYRANGYPPNLILDVKGNAVLSEGYTFDSRNLIFKMLLDSAHGCAYYFGDWKGKIKATYNGFVWSPSNDWKTSVPTPAGKYKNIAFRMSISFYCTKRTYPFDLYVASDLDDNLAKYPNYMKIPFLTIMWGCFAKGTEVTMYDNSIRMIEDIRIGEQVLNPFGGGSATVVNTWSGHEKILQHIETGNGRTVDASENHPLWTENGPKAAVEISEGDKLLAEGGAYDTVVQRYPLAYDGEVFNLELTCDGCADEDKAHTMICNGLVVGDNDLQNRITVCDNEPSPEPISEAMKQEWEAIRRLRKEREYK